MKKNNKYSVAAGILMFVLAALFSVSLMLVAVDFGGNTPAHNSFLYTFGKIFTRVYGLCSICIPVFLVVCGIQCFTSKWNAGNGVVLAGSVIPFFTLDAVEHICRMLMKSETGSVMMVKIGSVLLFGAMIIAAEYLLLSILGDIINRAFHKDDEESVFDEGDDNEEVEISEDEASETVEIAKNIENPEISGNVLERPEEETVFDEETENSDKNVENSAEETKEEDPFDFRNDKIFLEQKKLLKDLIAVGKSEEEVKKFEEELAESDRRISPVQEEKVEKTETAEKPVEEKVEASAEETEIPENQSESAEIQEEEIVEEKTPAFEFELPDPEATIVENSFDEEPAETSFEPASTEPEFVPETEVITDPDEPVDFSEPVFEESLPVSADDFEISETAQNFDEPVVSEENDLPSEPEISDEPFIPAEDSLPVIPEDFEGFENSEPVLQSEPEIESMEEPDFAAENDFTPVEPQFTSADDGFVPSDATPAPVEAFIDPSEFLDTDSEKESEEDDEYIEIEDIFSQMDEDAAENPVLKEKPEPQPEKVERNFDDPLFRAQNQTENFEEPVVDVDNEESEPNLDDELNNVEIFDMEEDEEDRSLNGVEGIDDDLNFSEEADDENSEEIQEPEFDDLEVNEIEEPDFSEEPDFVDEDEIEVSEEAEEDEDFVQDDGLSEEDKKAGIVPEDDPYERKQKRTIASYKISTDLLNDYENGEYWIVDEETKQAGENLKQTLNEFGIEAEVTGIRKGPVVTMFELLPAPGVKLSKIVSLQDNIALSLAASSVRIVAPIPGKHAVGIEVPNKKRAVVSFKEIVSEKLEKFDKMQIPVILGKDISGEPQLIDLAKTPHLLIAGSTGAGKSVCVNSMILSILYKRSPQQVRLVMIDPKVVELKLYNDIPHLLTPVITEPKKALQALQYCLCEMERRYALLDGMGVRDIVSYNRRIQERRIATEKLPYIVVVIDEFADLMATTGRELESTIARLAAMSRAVGIHLVLATQRPSVNVITGLIKANIPSRIAFMVASRQDSQIIIDGIGAEKLLGKGDMLYSSATDPFPTRIQGTLVSDDEVERVVNEVKQYGEPEYIDEEIFVDDEDEGGSAPGLFGDGEDPLYDQALQIVIQAGKASASYIQRRLKIGYNRAARLVEEMEERGIVGPANGSKPREVIHMP